MCDTSPRNLARGCVAAARRRRRRLRRGSSAGGDGPPDDSPSRGCKRCPVRRRRPSQSGRRFRIIRGRHPAARPAHQGRLCVARPPGATPQPGRRIKAGFASRGLQVQHQSRPLEGMTGRGAIGPETIVGLVDVVVPHGLPLQSEVLDYLMLVAGGMLVDDPLDDAQCPVQPAGIASDIRQGEKGFGAVHVAVGTAIVFFVAPVTVERLAHGAFFFAPEARRNHVNGLLQQRLSARAACDHRRAGRQRDKGVQVSSLAFVGAVLQGLVEPAAMLGITQWPGQRRDAVIDQRGATGNAVDMRHGETVGHACGVHGLSHGICGEATMVVQIAETLRQPGSLGKHQQPIALLRKPGLVARGAQPAAEIAIHIIHCPSP
nr:hypothetical protein [Tanacetum cinerariifolium]